MGIQNLLPFLANSSRDAHISEFENEFVAVDAYCWLHKGIYSCASELALKKPTKKYVTYCMRYIEMLLYFKVKPIMVFDGRQLYSKSETEKKRKEERKKKYDKGKELMRAGKTIEGRKLLGESVDVTHELALNLMRECRQKNIDCIVAPYEADAQLSFFSIKNIVKCVITEDSDLLAYGCERVMFKMDTSGRGKLINKSEIHLSLNITPEEFSEDIFRYMCILTGCDYLPSLSSIGPVYALKFIKMLKGSDIYEALPKLPIYVNKINLKVSHDYIVGFKIADNTFKHQLVYDPFLRKQIPLRPVKNDDDIVGSKLPDDLAFQLAVGNIDPNTMKKVDDFDPDKVCTGFDILWRSDLLPNAIPRQPSLTSFQTISSAKKRQREHVESDAVQSVTNDIKKQRIPPNITNGKYFSGKNSIQKVPESGFIFDPKIINSKKTFPKFVDEPKLLKSRYFSWENSNGQDKKLIGRLKDESYEDYLQRLYNEYFPVDENEAEDPETQKVKCYCGLQFDCSLQMSVLEKICSVCEKCRGCCSCNGDIKVSESQQLKKCIRDHEVVKENKQESQHCLFDELYKNPSEASEASECSFLLKEDDRNTENPSEASECSFLLKEDDRNTENEKKEEKLMKVSPTQSLSANFEKILSKLDSLKTVNSSTELVATENFEVMCDDDQEGVRSPSPVFKIQKESRVLSRNFRYDNVLDTTGTPTSVYFSSATSENCIESKSEVSPKSVQKNSRQKKPTVRSFDSLPAKAGKTNLKNTSANKTLFQFGFRKLCC